MCAFAAPEKTSKVASCIFYLFLFHSPSTVFIIFFLFFFFGHHSFVLVFFPFAPKLRKFFGHTKNSQVFVRRSKLVAFFSTLIFLLAFIFCFYACFCCCYVCDRSFLGDRLRCISVSSSPKNGGQASRSEVFFLVLAIFGYLL